jgi:hypothetical protein
MCTQLFKGGIGPRERALTALRVCWLCRAPFEWGEHVDIAKHYGVSDAQNPTLHTSNHIVANPIA